MKHHITAHLKPGSTELWKPIPGWEGLYEASNHGHIRSVDRKIRGGRGFAVQSRRGRVLRPKAQKSGHLQVGLSRNGKVTYYRVHRLILESFIGPPGPKEVCRHIDDDPRNNFVSNLSWGTATENMLDRVLNGVHHNSIKTHCIRGHLLESPNLVINQLKRGIRNCLACDHAVRKARKLEGLNVQSESDQRYRKIMGKIS